MIPRIRRGNDFKHVWPITWNGQPEDFSDATDITLTATVYGEVKALTEGVDYHIDGGTVMIDFTPAICDITGTYTVELNYIKPSVEFTDGDRRSAVDVQAFQIVNTSAESNATEGVSLPIEAMAAYALKYDDLTEAQKDELRGKGITSIDLTGEVGDTKTYTITYADGATFDFSVTDGHTPIFTFVGTVLYIDGVAGPDLKGETGNGIASVELTSTVGLVKTYTITFTDATTTTFTVTDGAAAVVQEKGSNTGIVMSQKAVTDELVQLAGEVTEVKLMESNFKSNIIRGYTEGRLLNELGNILTRNKYVLVDPILVEYGKTYYKKGNMLVWGYDKGGNPIKMWSAPVTSITIDDTDIQYVRYSETITDANDGLLYFSQEPFKSDGIPQSKIIKSPNNKANVLLTDLQIESDKRYIYTETEAGDISRIDVMDGAAIIPVGSYVRIIEADFIINELLTSLLYLKSAKSYSYLNRTLSNFNILSGSGITVDGNVATIPGNVFRENGLYIPAVTVRPYQFEGYIVVTIDFHTSHEKGISFADSRDGGLLIRGIKQSGTYLVPIANREYSNFSFGMSTYFGEQGTITVNSFQIETPTFNEIELGINTYYRNGHFVGYCDSTTAVSIRELKKTDSVTIDFKLNITKEKFPYLSIRDERGAELRSFAVNDRIQPTEHALFTSMQILNGNVSFAETGSYGAYYGNAVMSIRNKANEIRKLSITPSSVVLFSESDVIINTFEFTENTPIDEIVDALNSSEFDLEVVRYSSAGVRLSDVQECKFILSRSTPSVDEWGEAVGGNIIDSWPCFVYLKNAYNIPVRVILEKVSQLETRLMVCFNKRKEQEYTINASYEDIQVIADEDVYDMKIRDGVYLPRRAFGLMMHHMVDAKEYDGVSIPSEINPSGYGYTCTSGRFKRVLEYLASQGWKPVSVRDYVSAVYDPDDWGDNEKVFMVTFDDSNIDHYNIPTIQRYMIRNKIPAFTGLWKYSNEFYQANPTDWDKMIEIRDRLSVDGWCFGYHNYLHNKIDLLNYNQFKEQFDNMEAMMVSDEQLDTTYTGNFWDSTGIIKRGNLTSYGWIWAYGRTARHIQEYANQNGCPIAFGTSMGQGVCRDRDRPMSITRMVIDDVIVPFSDIVDLIDNL